MGFKLVLGLLRLQNRSFKPDFLVVRQSTCDANENWKNFLMGFLYGGVPSLNSLHALFNMHDRPWMVSNNMKISITKFQIFKIYIMKNKSLDLLPY